jgi:gas vesicle protein
MSVDITDDMPTRVEGTSRSPMQGMGSQGTRQPADGSNRPAQPIKEQASQLMDEAQNKVDETINVAQQEAKSMLGSQKGRAAESLGGIAQALRQTGEQMQDGQQAAMAQYAQRAADKIEQFSSQLQNKDVDQLLADVEGFARRRPEIFLGGALLLGFAAARFLKSSAPTPDMQMQMQDGGMQRGYEMNRPRPRSYQTGNL